VGIDDQTLFRRASLAATPEACVMGPPARAPPLASVTAPVDRARLLMCRARIRSNQWRTADVIDDARAAAQLFELAGEHGLGVAAASLGAAHASRLGDLSLASELAAKSILALDSVTDELRVEIANRLGIFCYSFLDYDRAVEQFETSLAAAERIDDADKIHRQLHNIADALLLASRQSRLSGLAGRTDLLDRADAAVRRLLTESMADMNLRSGGHRLLAEILCERGQVDEALRVLEDFRPRTSAITPAAQRAALASVEARCLRLAGRAEQAVTEASRAVAIAEMSGDDHELMLVLEELAACQEAAGDLKEALASARRVKAFMWAIHQRQTRQLVEETWARADIEKDRRDLQTRVVEATRSAEEDALTGIGNRRLLERFLSEDAIQDSDVAFIVLDVDHFKPVNDTLGHDVGDRVLRELAQLLESKTRAGQVAIRYGGDEFVLVLPGVSPDAAGEFAERLRSSVFGHDWASISAELHLTASFGIACGPASNWPAVIAAADALLYMAKQRGGNAVGTASIGVRTS
jgi:two-component system cell cycle response regulator